MTGIENKITERFSFSILKHRVHWKSANAALPV